MPGGRPTDYKEEYCNSVIEFGKQGFSRVQMAAEFEVAKATIQNWEKEHSEFLVAMTRAMTLSQAWWALAAWPAYAACPAMAPIAPARRR